MFAASAAHAEVVLKVLITGATGFIGGHLTEALVKVGQEVRALARSTSDTSLLKKLDVEIVNGDLRDAAAMKKAAAGCQCVYHLGGKTTKDQLPRKQYHAQNTQGTQNVGQAALDAGVERMVYSSSVGVYGSYPRSPIDENTAPNPDWYYREAKLGGEEEVLRLHRGEGLPVVVARLGSVYGPRSYSWLALCRKLVKGDFRIIGRGENYDQMGYINDVVDGLRRCGEVTGIEGKTYNITGGEPTRLRQVLQILAQELGADDSLGHLPGLPFLLYERIGEVVFRSLRIQPPRFHYYDLFFRDHFFETTKAQQELGYVPKIPLREGLGRLLEWYREKGRLPSVEEVQAARGAR